MKEAARFSGSISLLEKSTDLGTQEVEEVEGEDVRARGSPGACRFSERAGMSKVDSYDIRP